MSWPLPDAPDPALIRAVCLLLPAVVTWALLLCVRPRPGTRLGAGAFLASTWALIAVLVVNLVAIAAGWWSFRVDGGAFAGVPVDLWFGWALCWGAIPVLALGRVPLWLLVVGLLWLDVLLMPALAPVVQLGTHWLAGEAVGLVFALLPAQLLGRWTRDASRLAGRCALQVVLFTTLAVWLIPWLILSATDAGDVHPRELWKLSLAAQVLAVPAAMGGAAVMELYRHGLGTPFPLDPPRHLVSSGPYAYVANPMQLSMTLILAGLGVALGSLPVALGGLMAGAFGAGFASWAEAGDLATRFGTGWDDYRRAVRPWVPRWRPASGPTATLYYAAGCTACSTVGGWFAARQPVSLDLRPAATCPGPALQRITYLAGDGTAFSGVAALTRATDHLNLAWACVGWICRLPVVCQFLQVLVDAVGGGPIRSEGTGNCCIKEANASDIQPLPILPGRSISEMG